jgi:serine/threonine protein kinase/tetratricopeptide (TPR) repeat protein
LHSGQTFAHFEIIHKIGEGGMGEVFLARDTKLNRQVALKTLGAGFFDRPESKERFKREATTAASISHPNVMAIYDIGTAPDPESGQDIDYIVMEHIEGVSLRKVIAEETLDMAGVLRIAEKVAAGLAAAHKVNIVHRDLKPDNVIIDSNDEPKILDFGLAKPIDTVKMEGDEESDDTISKELTRAGTVVGTVSYMSPEQAQGQTVDSRSDVFSFGILLYRMATGELPFTGSTQVSILAKILEGRPEPPSARNSSVPAELERIIDKCLQKDANDRYQDTRDLVVDLRRLRRQYDSGVSESVSTLAASPGKRARSSPIGGIIKKVVLPLAGAALVVVVIMSFIRHGKGVPTAQATEPGLAILGFENKTGDDSLNWMQTGLPEILLTDLSQNGGVGLISQRRILDYLETESGDPGKTPTHQQLIEAAKALGATSILSGSFFRVGDQIRIDARIEDATTGKIQSGEKVVGNDPFGLVDSLTARLASALQLEGMAGDTVSVARVTTSSPDAYKHYILGLEPFFNGEYDNAVAEFKKALEYDSTFALPYMRLAMANIFQGRMQEGAEFLKEAMKYQDRLPQYEQNLLDIYADLWLRQRFDDAKTKLEVQVRNYPNDKESKSVLAIVLGQLTGDTTTAYRLLDEVLAQDPKYRLALDWYADLLTRSGDLDRAIELNRRLLVYYPGSPKALKNLADLYTRQQQYDRALAAYEDILKDHPGDATVLGQMSDIYIRERDFEKSRDCLEQIREAHKDDHYLMNGYYIGMSDYSNWHGKFHTAMTYRFKALAEAKAVHDTSIVATSYIALAEYYRRFGMPDSAYYYAREGYKMSKGIQKLDYPLTIVDLDTSHVAEAKSIFQVALNDLRERVPAELFDMADALQDAFNARVAQDTAKLIEAQRKIIKSMPGGVAANRIELGSLLINYGRYAEGLAILEQYAKGKDQSTSGYRYPHLLYYIGVANQELGNAAEAKKNFSEMLSYWGKPEIELKEIKEARKRLVELSEQT